MGSKNDFLKNNEKFGDPSGIILGGRVVDMSSLDENDVLVLKNGVWVGMPAGSGVGGSATQSPINVNGVNIGMYTSGDTIPAGTNLETIIANVLQKVTLPTYTAPSLSLSGTSPSTVEAGTTMNITLNASFMKNDAGAITSYKLYKNGSVIYSGPTVQSYTDTNVLITETPITYRAEVTYSDGTIKKTNLGVDYPTGRILAGTISSGSVVYTGVRKGFYGVSFTDTTHGATSAELRALTITPNKTVEGNTFSMNITAGTKKVIFAYPANLRNLTSIKYVEGMNAEIKEAFTLTPDVSVYGANAYTPVLYKVYTYIPVVPFQSNVTYNITI